MTEAEMRELIHLQRNRIEQLTANLSALQSQDAAKTRRINELAEKVERFQAGVREVEKILGDIEEIPF